MEEVGRVAGEARAGDAVLDDVEGLHHDRRNAGRSVIAADQLAAEHLAGIASPGRSVAISLIACSAIGSAEWSWTTVPRPKTSVVEVDGDDDFGAERARRRDRHRVDQGAVDQPAAVDADRLEDAGEGVGGAHRLDQLAARHPHLVAGAELGGDADEARAPGPRSGQSRAALDEQLGQAVAGRSGRCRRN